MMLTRRRLLALTAGGLAATALPAFASDSYFVAGRAFGTTWQARLRGDGNPAVLAERWAEVLSSIDLAMSPFRQDSEISRFNRATAGEYRAGADFATVAAEALQVATLTGGAFDPSVGPDVGRFGFGPIHGQRSGGYSGLAAGDALVSKSDAALTLDLCGIAKGYALDLMCAESAAAGFSEFLIELGGEIATRGQDARRTPWQVGISNPLGGLYTTIDARGLAVATSGDAINAFEVGGRRYSHIIDPTTGEPVISTLASVTALAPRASTADALATALFVMGSAKGLEFAAAHGLPVLFLIREEGSLRPVMSDAFQVHLLG
jgi:thiamine biosynthesis lipoprotein